MANQRPVSRMRLRSSAPPQEDGNRRPDLLINSAKSESSRFDVEAAGFLTFTQFHSHAKQTRSACSGGSDPRRVQ